MLFSAFQCHASCIIAQWRPPLPPTHPPLIRTLSALLCLANAAESRAGRLAASLPWLASTQTFRLELGLARSALNVYRIFGSEADPMMFEGAAFEWVEEEAEQLRGKAVEEVDAVERQQRADGRAWHSFVSVGLAEVRVHSTAAAINPLFNSLPVGCHRLCVPSAVVLDCARRPTS